MQKKIAPEVFPTSDFLVLGIDNYENCYIFIVFKGVIQVNEQKKGYNEKCTGCGIYLVPSTFAYMNTKGELFCTPDCEKIRAVKTKELILGGEFVMLAAA